MAKRWKNQLVETGRDLINLEINTIESKGTIGRKMPSYPHALLEIAQKYAAYLASDEIGVDLVAFEEAIRSKTEEFEREIDKVTTADEFEVRIRDHSRKVQEIRIKKIIEKYSVDYGGKLTNGWKTFEMLRWASSLRLAIDKEEGFQPLNDRQKSILIRIRRNCDQLKIVSWDLENNEGEYFIGETTPKLEGLDWEGIKNKSRGEYPKPAPTHHMSRIRKAWDLGVDEIVLQTVIQLDGDIMLRALKESDLSSDNPLYQAHRQATDVALKHWHALFQLVADALKTTIGGIFGSSKT